MEDEKSERDNSGGERENKRERDRERETERGWREGT